MYFTFISDFLGYSFELCVFTYDNIPMRNTIYGVKETELPLVLLELKMLIKSFSAAILLLRLTKASRNDQMISSDKKERESKVMLLLEQLLAATNLTTGNNR